MNTKRILVVYYSLGGNTASVAQDIAAHLGADVERLRERKNRRGFLGHVGAAIDSARERPAELEALTRQPGDYDLILIGTPIWAGKITPAARACLKAIRGKASDVAFFITSGSTDIARVAPVMQGLVGREPLASVSFTERELRDWVSYTAKLRHFLAAIGTRAARPKIA